ncbi:MAG: hypothetical protein WCH39_05865 [Schlesneria sp.]
MTDAPFIFVCHPLRNSGFATPCQTEQDLVDRWQNGWFDVKCNCCAEESLVATYEAAIEDIGHDMHHMTRLNSRSEYDQYMARKCHNKSPDSVYRAALILGWVDIDDDEPESDDN